MKPNERDAYVQAVIRDSTKLRGLRWEMVVLPLAYQPCTDIRQVIFGVDEMHIARLAEAREGPRAHARRGSADAAGGAGTGPLMSLSEIGDRSAVGGRFTATSRDGL